MSFRDKGVGSIVLAIAIGVLVLVGMFVIFSSAGEARAIDVYGGRNIILEGGRNEQIRLTYEETFNMVWRRKYGIHLISAVDYFFKDRVYLTLDVAGSIYKFVGNWDFTLGSRIYFEEDRYRVYAILSRRW